MKIYFYSTSACSLSATTRLNYRANTYINTYSMYSETYYNELQHYDIFCLTNNFKEPSRRDLHSKYE